MPKSSDEEIRVAVDAKAALIRSLAGVLGLKQTRGLEQLVKVAAVRTSLPPTTRTDSKSRDVLQLQRMEMPPAAETSFS